MPQFKHDYPKADNLQKNLTKVRADIRKLIDAIEAGLPGEALHDEMQQMQQPTKQMPNL